ncbi:MAG TPA: 2-oxoglutarate dehydrogenase complex dihydrolipoyllysine-residue succinyltransferase [Armatimonadota bacterium]|jgi:2-oxoglutarate dehydrogenase E2 component (dihydrolipoamide succinyltransferase)
MPFDIVVPQLGESVVDATLGRWLKKPGDAVAEGEAVLALETDKVDLDVTVERAGVLSEILRNEGDTVQVGEVLGRVVEGAPQNAAADATPPAPPPAPATATPLARSMARVEDVDIAAVPGTGPGGKVTRTDVEGFIQHAAPETVPSIPAPTPPPVLPQFTSPPAASPQLLAPPAAGQVAATDRPEQRVRMSRRRQTIATRLVEAQHTAAMLTSFNEADMSSVMALRAAHRDAFKERYGVGLGYMSFFTKAVVSALKVFPMLNAEIQGDEMVLKGYYDIGIAVSTDEGLVVPVVRDADRKTFAELERDVAGMAARARDGKLTLPELQGGTFTITNGGVFGSLLSTPILNTPQVGILGMHKIQDRPVALNGAVVIRPMMNLALSYDHRIVDGAEAVRFLVHVKQMIEDPSRLLLEG